MIERRPSINIWQVRTARGNLPSPPTCCKARLRVTELVNADVIARSLSAFDPESAAIAAGRVMLTRIHELAEERASFAFETTLASRTFVPWLRDLRASGFALHLLFLWLSSADLAVERVAKRVAGGGHNVPADTVRRRYHAGIRNFFTLYQPIVSSWTLYNAPGPEPMLVAESLESESLKVYDRIVWEAVQRQANE